MDKESADGEIRTRLAAGDSSALEMIWTHYASDLFGYLVSLLCSRHDAEDTLQDVFVTLARKREAVAGARHLKPYLFRVARNVALNRIKKIRRMRARDHDYVADWLVLEKDGGEGRNQETRDLEAALATLPEKQRTVVVLKFYRGQTFREIGEMLGISENTAGSRYRYGMEKLRTLLEADSSSS